jgi:hypothetical protein
VRHYGIVATRGTRFTHHGTTADGGGDWRWRGGLVGFGRRCRVKMKAPKGASVFVDPSGMVDSAWAVAHRCGSDIHMAARVSTIADQKFVVQRVLYIGLCAPNRRRQRF